MRCVCLFQYCVRLEQHASSLFFAVLSLKISEHALLTGPTFKMPMKRGHVSAPQNTFIDTIIRKFDSQSTLNEKQQQQRQRRTLLSELDRRFLISNAQLANKPIIYCNDGFCELTGYSRSDIIQKPCTCEFLYGDETSDKSIKQIRHALQGNDEKEVDIILYKNTGR